MDIGLRVMVQSRRLLQGHSQVTPPLHGCGGATLLGLDVEAVAGAQG
jgi:hypothetical protein